MESNNSLPDTGTVEPYGTSLKAPAKKSRSKFASFTPNSNPRQEKHKPKYAFPIEIDLNIVNSKVGSFAETTVINAPLNANAVTIKMEDNAGIIQRVID